METLSNSKPKARKEHQCNYCNGKIEIGEIYNNGTHVYEGAIYNWKNHLECQNVAEKLNMFEFCDEGLTQEDFVQTVNDYFYDNLVGDCEDDVRTTFLERLKMVKEDILKNL